MNQETKDVVLALLSGRNYIYSLLHTLLGAEPTPEIVAAAAGDAAMQAVALFDSEESPAAKLLAAALHLLKDTKIEDLKGEYTRLFLGPEDYIAAPWESVYTSKERALFQESTLDVRVWFGRFGYVAGGYPNQPDDHICLMMDFLARTSVMAAEQLEGGDAKACSAVLEDQKAFEQAHMLNWLKRYAVDMQGSESNFFYPQLAAAVAEFVEYDQQILDELIAACAE